MIDHRIHRTARYGRNITWGAFAVIDERATIGDGATIGPLSYIAPGVTIGAGAEIGARAIVLADVPDGGRVGINELWRSAPVVAQEGPGATKPPAPVQRGKVRA